MVRFRERNTELYTTFRFAITLPNRGDEMLRAMSVYCDPFTNELWIGRAHFAGEKTLAQLLCEETRLEVFMLPRGNGSSRRVLVDFVGLRALPLNLDASCDEIALEWVVLQKVCCSPPFDVETPERFKQPAITKTTAGAAAREPGERWLTIPCTPEVLGDEPLVELEVRVRVPESIAERIRRGEMTGFSMGATVPKCEHEFCTGRCRLCGYVQAVPEL
jgi:hypothetical protein